MFPPCTPSYVNICNLAQLAPCFPSWACVECPHWTRLMCITISLILMTTLVEWENISRWHCRLTPPHLWSLCNGPKSWDNVSWPIFPFYVLATFTLPCSTCCFKMQPTFHLALWLFQSQSQRHWSGSQFFCQSRPTSTQMLSPKCLSRFQRFHYMFHPIHNDFFKRFIKGVAIFAKFLMNLQ